MSRAMSPPDLAAASAQFRATLEQMGRSLDGLLVRPGVEPAAGPEDWPARITFRADAALERAIRDGAAASGLTVAAFLRRTLADALEVGR